jgi:Tetratricopeptide repeat
MLGRARPAPRLARSFRRARLAAGFWSNLMGSGLGRSLARLLVGAGFLALAASMAQATAPAQVQATQYNLSFISNSTWTADPIEARVHVVAEVTATSHTLASATPLGYYDRIELTLPQDSTAIQASAGTQQLSVATDEVSPSGVVVTVGLGQRLYSGESGTFELRFDLVDSGGSTDRDLRIGHNLMSFPVSAFGSPGTPGSTVTVLFPPDFTVQEEFGGLTRSVYGSGAVAFSSGVIDDSTALNAWFTAVQPVPASAYAVRSVTIGPLSVSLRYWADDVGWADQVERILRAGYPLLHDMIGVGDPAAKTLTVEEASTQEIGGFSGSFDQIGSEIQISYFADPFVILHETAHLWFNSSLVSDRWIQEGFASYYAQQAVDKLGLADHAPVLTDQMRAAAVPLNDWITAGEPGSATDAYLYGASLEVAQMIATEAGQQALRSVWQASKLGAGAYQPLHGTTVELLGGAPDWRRFLDLLEQLTGHSYAATWRLWVVDPAQAPLLDQRSAALTTYAGTMKVAGAWDLPPEIRSALGNWQFDEAVGLMAQSRSLLSERNQMAIEAATEQTSLPPTLQIAFEHTSLAAAQVEASNESAVLSQLAAARQAETDNGGAALAVGLLGVDPRADLVAAREAFAQGDLTRAMSLATNARDAWASASGTGQARIFGSLCVLAGLLLLLGLFVWTRGGGRGRATAAAAIVAGAPQDAASPPRKRGKARRLVPGLELAAALGGAGEGPSPGPTDPARGSSPAGADPIGPARTSSTTGANPTDPADPPAAGHSGDQDPVSAAVADDPAPVPAAADPDPAAGEGAAPAESAYELLQRGSALLRDRHNAQAAVVLERASRLEASKGSILEALGRAYFNSGQHARAAETFEALLEVDPSAHYGHFALGLSFSRLGRMQEARTHLRLAAALDPSSETYRRALARIEATDN